jgi:hypothetical protein
MAEGPRITQTKLRARCRKSVKVRVTLSGFEKSPGGSKLRMRSADRIAAMFAGMLHQQMVYASHPVIVVESEQVCGAFGSVEAAEKFIVGKGSYCAVVYTLRDSNWVITRDRRINPLLPHNAKRPGAHRPA